MTARAFAGKCPVVRSERIARIDRRGGGARREQALLLQQSGQGQHAEAVAGTAQELAPRLKGRARRGEEARQALHDRSVTSNPATSIHVNEFVQAHQHLAEVEQGRLAGV